MYDLCINVDVVENVCNKAIFLSKLRLIAEEVARFFEGDSKITDDLGQRRDIVARWSKRSEAVAIQACVSCVDDSVDGLEV
jgi:hypothetical protein